MFALNARAALRVQVALAAALALAGCTLAPRYERPAAPVPATYAPVDGSAAPAAEVSPADAALLDDWHTYFTDAALQAWID
ncbi:TPA: multidrug transporter, partial [Burkholderia lata]